MLEIGSLVDGKYKVLRVVGKGGMSVVYQAVNEKANKIWAIKEVRKDGVQNYEVVKQNLIVETELLKRFNHPNLPSIIDVIDTDDAFLIVMDYIEGNSLAKRLEESGAQDQDDVVEWAMQLCDVLGYLHSRKPPIIYRDMKPSNVMLKPDGNISLIDFGTAREFKSTSVEDTTCLGTQGYAAPEQYGGHGQTDARTDIYCLGATMYHLVTGHNPSMPPYEMYPIRQWDPTLSSGLEKIILKCTQRNPDDRYRNCAELMYDLEHYRDLDIENLKSQNKKWKLFLTCAIITLAAAVGALGFKLAESSAKASTYDGLIKEAVDNKADGGTLEDSEKILSRAIELEPENTTAYQEMLNLYIGGNDLELTEEEHLKIRAKIRSHEDVLSSKNPSGYAELAKTLADDAFFSIGAMSATDNSIDETKGYQYASNWYATALEMCELTHNEEMKAEVSHRKTIVDAYISPGGLDREGNPTTDYAETFRSMKSIVENDEIEASNIAVKMRCYKVITYLLSEHDNDFFNSGEVDRSDYDALVDTIDEKLTEIENSDLYQNNTESNKGYLKQMMTDAKQYIENIRHGSDSGSAASQ
ncbi:MAG: serine/threonine protein kinase [Ruminococcus sp.]|nr:serine/threonine protein kinase [Ruminococcus sp.]